MNTREIAAAPEPKHDEPGDEPVPVDEPEGEPAEHEPEPEAAA